MGENGRIGEEMAMISMEKDRIDTYQKVEISTEKERKAGSYIA